MKRKRLLALTLLLAGFFTPFLTLLATKKTSSESSHDWRFFLALNFMCLTMWISFSLLAYWRRQELKALPPAATTRRSGSQMIGHSILAVIYTLFGVGILGFFPYAFGTLLIRLLSQHHYLAIFPTASLVAVSLYGGYTSITDGIQFWKGQK